MTQTRGDAPAARPSRTAARNSGGPLARLSRFVREVIAELGKVIWPTRKELLTYTSVVIAFVTVMTAIVAVLDYGFGKGILLVLGGK